MPLRRQIRVLCLEEILTMASRTLLVGSAPERTRITVTTLGGTLEFGWYTQTAWGFEIIREAEQPRSRDWWNPLSWFGGPTDFIRAGAPPFREVFVSRVTFTDASGNDISRRLGTPGNSTSTGYAKTSFIFTFLAVPIPFVGRPTELGNDARSIRNMAVSFRVNDDSVVLSHR